ncbi:MAG TPA: hypothetical protein VJN71_05370, partial [Nitrososphaerales archaeon]|nr:hypothetical protein [Nitrososphaerales archaeon]
GKEVIKYGVKILGVLNLPSTMAPQASQLYSRNITSFLLALSKEGKLTFDLKDELIRSPAVLHNGEVLHEPTAKALSGGSPK